MSAKYSRYIRYGRNTSYDSIYKNPRRGAYKNRSFCIKKENILLILYEQDILKFNYLDFLPQKVLFGSDARLSGSASFHVKVRNGFSQV